MEIRLSTSGMDALRKLQRKLAGGPGHFRATCILMSGMGKSLPFEPSCLCWDVSILCRYRSACLHGGGVESFANCHKGYWNLFASRQLSSLRKKSREHVCTNVGNVPAWIKSTFAEELSAMPEDAVVYYADGLLDAQSVADMIAHDCESANAESAKDLLSGDFGSPSGKNLLARTFIGIGRKTKSGGPSRNSSTTSRLIKEEEMEALLTLNFCLAILRTIPF